jgi:flagellar biosynthetic protein FliS
VANPQILKAYKENRNLGWTRVDLILAVYDGILDQLGRARDTLAQPDEEKARAILAKARIGVETLAAGVDLVQGEVPANFRRLYDFVLHCLAQPQLALIDAAQKVLRPLHEAFQTIRNQALDLERKGVIPSLEPVKVIQASA